MKVRKKISFLLRQFILGVFYAALIHGAAQDAGAGSGSGAVARRTADEQEVIDVYKSVNEAVVFISTITLTVDPFDLFMEVRPVEGSGSGVIVDSQRGIVLTNLHVIQDAQKIEIMLASGKSYRARLLGADDEYDLAVLQIPSPREDLVAVEFGDSSKLEVGQRVLAIGNPFGLNRTLTLGIVSSLNRTVRSPGNKLMRGLVQTDAAINPGNSGGPLLDAEGRIIGINTAILSRSGDSAGIGFAVPINRVRSVLPELIATGRVLRPAIGWVLVDTDQGPMVYRVLEGSPAAEAGVEPIERRVESVFVKGFVRDFNRADLIVRVNGKRVANRDQVEEILAQSEARRSLTFHLRRGGLDGPEREVVIKPVLR